MADRLVTKHVPKRHLIANVRTGALACPAEHIKVGNATSIPQLVTCDRCRNTTQYVDAVARRLVLDRGRRPRKATR